MGGDAMSSKLREAYGIREDVIDKTKQHGKSLENMGVRRHEVRDAESLSAAIQQVISQSSFAIKSLQHLAKKVAPDVDINSHVEKVLRSLNDIKSAYVSAPEEKPDAQDPKTGFQDDPNPETRGTKHKNRGYRAG